MIPSCMEYGKYNLYIRIGFAYLSYYIYSLKKNSFDIHVYLNLYYNSMYTETIKTKFKCKWNSNSFKAL